MATRPRLTAAICTHAGADRIGAALASLREQRDAPDEILVLDNAPPDGRTATLVRAELPEARYEVEPVPGLDIARNAVLRRSSGDVVAFLDDDAVADAGWVEGVRHAFSANPRLLVSTCRVTALRLDTEARRLFEANGGLDRGPDAVLLPRDAQRTLNGRRGTLVAWATRIGIGCGMGVRRREALELGGFDPALDLGAALPGGGDTDLVWRAVAAGWEAAYLPEVGVLHDHRAELGAAVRQMAGHQRALVALLTKIVRDSRGPRRREALAFLAWRLAKPGLRLAKRLAGSDPLPPAALLRMWWACWRGLGAYPAARRLARRRLGTRARPTLRHEGGDA